jgi:carboxyl-terminal processing protease
VKKISNLLGGFVLTALLLSNDFAQTAKTSPIKPKTSDEIQTTRPAKTVTTEKIGLDVAEALTLIEDNHVGGKKLDYNELFKSSITSMLHTLDPHSNYFDAKEFEQFRTEQSSRYFGIGASIGSLSDKNGKVIATYIRATFEDAPANRAGLRYGDKIVEVNGVSMLGKPSAEVSSNLRGPRGTVAKITVERHGTGKRETVEIIRDAVSQPSIAEAYMVRPASATLR